MAFTVDSCSQVQEMIPLLLLDGRELQAVAGGGYASWNCRCRKRKAPLMGYGAGRKGFLSTVRCPDCSRCFRVFSDKQRSKPKFVQEVKGWGE